MGTFDYYILIVLCSVNISVDYLWRDDTEKGMDGTLLAKQLLEAVLLWCRGLLYHL